MRIERVAILTLTRHNDNYPAPCDAPQLSDGLTMIEHMFDHMGADNSVKLAVRKGECLDLCRHVFNALQRVGVINSEIDTCEATKLWHGSANARKQVARAASDITDTVAQNVSADRRDARFGIIGAFVNTGVVSIKSFIFPLTQEGSSLASSTMCLPQIRLAT